MRIPFGDGGGCDAAHARSRDPCHRARDLDGALAFFWPDVEVQPGEEIDLGMDVPNGDGVDGTRCPKKGELASATKYKSPTVRTKSP